MNRIIRNLAVAICLFISTITINAQEIIKGKINDGAFNDVLIGANVTIQGTTVGTVTEGDGTFEIKTTEIFPLNLEVSYLGYETQVILVSSPKDYIETTLQESSVKIVEVTVKASRISEANKKSALTVESLDAIAIKETASSNFYEGLGTLKNVDLTTASLGFQVVNTRGFNSTSPVRSLQIIDGSDNQAPGLNFSLGNFLGASELDVNKVDLIVGASSAFYGPNAFNGVIKMDTKNPFFQRGLAASVKVGERQLLTTEVRWADALENNEGEKWFAYKLNGSYTRANDWQAENYDPVFESESSVDNPGGYDAVNIYGDEYQRGNDVTDQPIGDNAGLNTYHRTGYKEKDLVDYNTRNYKANAAFHFRTKPSLDFESPEIIICSSFGGGNTVYQGDNRFSLRGITFFQNRIEYRKKNKYFLRAYSTTTTAGDSYDPYFTALQLQELGKSDTEWSKNYSKYYRDNVKLDLIENGFPQPVVVFDPLTGEFVVNFDPIAAQQFLDNNSGLLTTGHQMSRSFADGPSTSTSGAPGYLVPGTEAFQTEFDRITTTLRNGEEGGTKFFDQSSLYHIHGEYKFKPTWVDEVTVGANGRLYTPYSKGTIFDDEESKITNSEFGIYGGASKLFMEEKLKADIAVRLDKNQNFDPLLSPAASLVWTPKENQVIRASFSSAIRNPTLADQYLNLMLVLLF